MRRFMVHAGAAVPYPVPTPARVYQNGISGWPDSYARPQRSTKARDHYLPISIPTPLRAQTVAVGARVCASDPRCSARPVFQPGSARPPEPAASVSASAVITPRAKTHRLLAVCHVPPFSDRCRHLLWHLLTSDDPSRYLTAPVAGKQQIIRPPRVRRATFPLIPAA